jgi:hypothetical protein
VTAKAEGHVPKVSWYYLHTMRSVLRDLYFSEVIQENPEAWVYKYTNITGDTAVYACWAPTSEGSTYSYNFFTDLHADTINLISLVDKSIEGISTILPYDTTGILITVSEAPIFIKVINDTSSVLIDTTAISSGLPGTTIGFDIFPNPTDYELNVSIKSNYKPNQFVTLNLYDIVGRRIFEQDDFIRSGKLISTINTRQLPEGIFFLNILGQNISLNKSFVISR